MFLKFLLGAVLLSALAPRGECLKKVTQSLTEIYKSTYKSTIVFDLPSVVDVVMAEVTAMNYPKTEQPARLRSRLREVTSAEQGSFLTKLEELGLSNVTSRFWITNRIIVDDVSLAQLQQLQEIPGNYIIREQVLAKLSIAEKCATNTTKPRNEELQPNLDQIGVKALWDKGFTGQGAIVGVIDSGVRGSHTLLKSSYAANGENSWYDPVQGHKEPTDSMGHGTHVTGIITGADGHGVAPDAKWIACKAFPPEGTDAQEKHLLACGEFMYCPDYSEGCKKAPDIVNNSWGKPSYDDFYWDIIRVWGWNNIVPIFAAGNDPQWNAGCRSIFSPAHHDEVITVGAINSCDEWAPFSCCGPNHLGHFKPDLVAPGMDIISANWTSDTATTPSPGTSMAAPHVAGVAAIMRSRKKELTTEQIRTRLIDASFRPTGLDPEDVCNYEDADLWSNNVYGHGRLDCRALVI